MASFIGGDYSRAVPVVSSFYHIVDMQRHPTEDAVRFLIAESEIYSSFPKLVRELAKVDMIATAKRSKYASRLMPSLSSTNVTVEDGIVVTVSKIQKPHKPHSKYLLSIPVILFIATLTVVFIDGLYRSQSEFANAFIHNPILLAVVYTMSLVGILGVHEMGHMIAAKHHGIRASWPYFIPGIPGLFVPTFGAMIQIRSNMTNRNVLFDVGIAGPIAGLLVTMVVSVYGSSISVLVPADRVHDLFGDSPLMRINSSILMQTTLNIMGHGAMAGDAVLIMSPVLFAAWVGFLITFLNLLPAWQLDGGHLARSALGVRWHRVLTYSSIGILTGLGYFIMAAFVLIFSSRAPESTPLDDVSPLSKKRRVLFWVAIALAVLCAPLPSAIFRPLA